MLFRGLKINIAIHTAILLMIGMALIGLVAIHTFQRVLVQSESDRGRLLLKAMESHAAAFMEPLSGEINDEFRYMFQEMVLTAGFCYALLKDSNSGRKIEIGLKEDVFDSRISEIVSDAMRTGTPSSQLTGITWDVLGRQPRYIALAIPLFGQNHVSAGVGVVFDLEKNYTFFRQTQFVLFILMMINTAILTFIGMFSMGKIIVRPIQRLVNRVDAFNEADQQIFFSDKKDSEFNTLSKSINSMVRRIALDKEKLQQTIRSLEQSNSELKQAQNDVIRAEKMASVGRLAAGIAHEIGNPIGIVMGYMELLGQDDITDDERTEFLTRAEDEIGRIDLIIKQLLNYSRTSDYQSETVSVHQVIRDTLEIVKFQPVMAALKIRSELTAQNDTVRADANQLRQVCLNLILNAADAIADSANRDNGQLLITSTLLPDAEVSAELHTPAAPHDGSSVSTNQNAVLQVSFTDNGSGIASTDIDYIFDPFFTTKEPGKGTGLGLSVSFKIIERLGGVISAVSDGTEGTTMTIQLPLCSLAPAD